MNNHQEIVQTKPQYEYITEDDVKVILTNYGYVIDEITIKHYEVNLACEDKMLGFLADHLILKVEVISNNEQNKHNFFIKALPKNEGKAFFVSSLNMFDIELTFYKIIKSKLDIPDLKPWSGKLVANFENAVVFEDLTSLQYVMHNKEIKFDIQHVLEALRTLARFHASSIIYEETMSKNLNRPYRLDEEYGQYLRNTQFDAINKWFVQCRLGALVVVKEFSKYKDNKDQLKLIEDRWRDVWNSALNYNHSERSVICHSDLWNNNLLFHYKRREDGTLEPDDCVLVDFQAINYQPPSRDVMFLLYCTLTPQFRTDNTDKLLQFYLDDLKNILWNNGGVNINDIISKDSFLKSAKENNLWGLVVHIALVQIVGLDDNLAMEMFSEAAQFEEIVWKNRSAYIRAMISKSDIYKRKLVASVEELVAEFILIK